ncbi:MAG: D-alanyl-D-alanine carboxypeptidase [Actinobacteria bacterium]|nr:D-alanyl-D-alanine carboxypeptidase [Actinomycetota bacterium]
MMRRALLPVAALLAAVALSPVARVQASNGDPTPTAPVPVLAASAWYLVGEDGSVLAERNEEQRRAIASITKLMTAIVTLQRARLADLVTVGARSSGVGESTAHLRAGERLNVSMLLRAMLVASANDAADALALHVGRGSISRFVALMNAEARELGLDDTTFANPHGLDATGHLSSAEDATTLVRYALGIPFIRDALGRSSVVLPRGGEFPTTDDLLESWPPLVGGKTGHTADAGWSQAAAARSRGVTVYGTVLGSRSRNARNDALQELLTYGLARYRPIVAIDAGRVYATATTAYGRPAVVLVARRTVVRSVHDRSPLLERVVAQGVVGLPVRRGQRLGRVEVSDGSRLIASSNLVAAAAVSEPGIFGKTAWYARRTARNVWGLVT